ncbi:MAG: hypothetical protein LBE21_07105 [Pseudomonadales bacterium]|jgi:hypothetical protein|nr:hypothetical protein [Pseudomonadales bacterium]
MNWEPLANFLENSWLHTRMVETFWLFPLCETLHFLGLIVLFGALSVIDFRVLGVAKFVNMKASMAFIPVALIGFAVNFITGIAFLAADGFRYFPNFAFQWKMALIAMAGINALWFWFGEHKELVQLADGQDAPFRAKVIALLSLVIWVLVIIAGRMIPYAET